MTPPIYQIFSLAFPSPNTGYATGDGVASGGGLIVKTSDGGNTWVPQVSGVLNHLTSIYCLDNNTCYAVGRNGTIIKTTDGGITWLPQVSGTT